MLQHIKKAIIPLYIVNHCSWEIKEDTVLLLFSIMSLPCSNVHLITIHIIADVNACPHQRKASMHCGVLPVPFVLFELNSILKKKKLIMLNEVSANAFPK